jgi:hypothetical protein
MYSYPADAQGKKMTPRKIQFLYKIVSACFFMFGFCVSDAVAQDPGPINTERPGFSSSPMVLATGFWQLEAGYQLTRNSGADTLTEQTLPNALLRFGFYQNFELQLSGVSFKRTSDSGVETDGFQDVGLGVKWQVNGSDAVVPIGLLASVSLPVGSSEFTSDSYDPAISVFWSHSGHLEWFGTAKAEKSGGQYSYDNAVGISLSLKETTGAFVELHSSFPEGSGPSHNLNGGITWRLAYELQVDVNGTIGLNSRANDYSVGMGIGYRF